MTQNSQLTAVLGQLRGQLEETQNREQALVERLAAGVAEADGRLLGEFRLIVAQHEQNRTDLAHEVSAFAARIGVMPSVVPRHAVPPPGMAEPVVTRPVEYADLREAQSAEPRKPFPVPNTVRRHAAG